MRKFSATGATLVLSLVVGGAIIVLSGGGVQAAPSQNIKSIALGEATSPYTLDNVGKSGSALLVEILLGLPDDFYKAVDLTAHAACRDIVSGRKTESEGKSGLHASLETTFYPIAKTVEQVKIIRELVSIVRFSSFQNNCQEIGNTGRFKMVP